MEHEEIIQKLHPHPLLYLRYYVGGIIFLIIGFYFHLLLSLLGVLIFVLGEVVRRATTYVLSEHGVARVYRFLSTYKYFVEYRNIQNIEVRQSFLENILGVGSIHFDTSGSDSTEVNFEGVSRPYEIEKRVIQKMRAQ